MVTMPSVIIPQRIGIDRKALRRNANGSFANTSKIAPSSILGSPSEIGSVLGIQSSRSSTNLMKELVSVPSERNAVAVSERLAMYER